MFLTGLTKWFQSDSDYLIGQDIFSMEKIPSYLRINTCWLPYFCERFRLAHR